MSGISHKQIKMMKVAARSLSVELVLPEYEVSEANLSEAKAVVAEWTSGGWKPRKGSADDVVGAIADRLALADALSAEGITRADVTSAISHWKRIRNRRDVSPTRKAEGFLDRLGILGSYVPEKKETKLLSFGSEEPAATNPQVTNPQLGLGFGGPRFGGPVAVADAPRPGDPTNEVVTLAAQLAAQGLNAAQIAEAIKAIRSA